MIIIEEIINIAKKYLEKEINAYDFESNYIFLFNKITPQDFEKLDEALNLSINRIFSAVDRFCDNEYPEGSDITETQLRAEVTKWIEYISKANH